MTQDSYKELDDSRRKGKEKEVSQLSNEHPPQLSPAPYGDSGYKGSFAPQHRTDMYEDVDLVDSRSPEAQSTPYNRRQSNEIELQSMNHNGNMPHGYVNPFHQMLMQQQIRSPSPVPPSGSSSAISTQTYPQEYSTDIINIIKPSPEDEEEEGEGSVANPDIVPDVPFTPRQKRKHNLHRHKNRRDLQPLQKHRTIYCNDPTRNAARLEYSSNAIKTSRYNVITFLPKNLYEQFRRVANFYFLVIACMQMVPGLSATNSYTTIVPLLLVLGVTAVKEAYEDYKRHVADNAVNNTPARVLRGTRFVDVTWKDIVVGDIVKVESGEGFPADLVLLNSSEAQGMCYIETSNLDGETNLKLRQALIETVSLHTPQQLLAFTGTIETEHPNNMIHVFNGSLTCNGKSMKMPLNTRQTLLRGCALRNTEWVYGIAVYTGEQTKLMQNQTKAPSKRSTLERSVNWGLVHIFLVLLTVCIIATIASALWTDINWRGMWYLDYSSSAPARSLLNFFTFLITFALMIPISLYVSLEMVKVAQALLIGWDEHMYYAENDTPAKARTSNLSEELGQIQYVFSDKTGTLTRNTMEFMKCSIGSEVYGKGFTEAQVQNAKREGVTLPLDDSEPLPGVDPKFPFKDARLIEHLRAPKDPQAQRVADFLTLLAVCHTVVPEPNRDNPAAGVLYQAASPDEGALVVAAKNLGYYFHTRTPDTVVVRADGVDRVFRILQVLEFSSDRKRMSVIVRTPEGKVKLLCKGADNVIMQRLRPGHDQEVQQTLQYLEQFASDGLRTLTLAQADLDDIEYAKWSRMHHDASVSIFEREQKLEEAAEMIEKNLTLVGTTAIEDKLQEGVPEAIYNMRKAGIRVWVLTGDKQETAINIGFSCQLLTNDMDIVVINAKTKEDTRDQLEAALASHIMKHSLYYHVNNGGLSEKPAADASDVLRTVEPALPTVNSTADLALVIDGMTLTHALADDMKDLLLELSKFCKSVVCCRATPLQKAQVVKLVRDNVQAVTLAIGDGANDVSMIQAAHVGVGISGQEGMQAVMSSDYAIAQFQYLYRLMMVHGRWDYKRNSKLILYCFYKNMLFALTQFWFAWYSGFSGMTMYDGWTMAIYNLVFTSLPIIVYSIFEQDISARVAERFPQLYRSGHHNQEFNLRRLWVWLLDAAYHSIIIFFTTVLFFGQSNVTPNGLTEGMWFMGSVCYAGVVVVANLRLALELQYWTWLNHVFVWLCIASYFIWTLIYTALPIFFSSGATQAGMYMLAEHMFGAPSFWFVLLLITMLCLLPDVFAKVIARTWFPRPEQILQEVQKYSPEAFDRAPEVFDDAESQTARLVFPGEDEQSIFKRGVRRTKDFGRHLVYKGRSFTASGFAFDQDSHSAAALGMCIGRRKKNRSAPALVIEPMAEMPPVAPPAPDRSVRGSAVLQPSTPNFSIEDDDQL